MVGHMDVRIWMTVLSWGLFTGCGGASKAASKHVEHDKAKILSESSEPRKESKLSAKSEASSEVAAAEPDRMPTACDTKVGQVCLPPAKFAKAVCDRDYPTVALAMFAHGSPWTRAYLTTKTRAWNASGGGSSNEQMGFDEEVILLRHRVPKTGGMTVSGAGEGYDALRWDGSCVTLAAQEVTFRKPAKPKNARIIWKRLELDVRDALKQQAAIRPNYLKHRKHCKGVSMGRVSKKCVKADGVLSRTVAAFIRESGEMPAPKKLP